MFWIKEIELLENILNQLVMLFYAISNWIIWEMKDGIMTL